jgi:hypothetical protein
MNKSFKDRLATLEALETRAAAIAFDRSPLTEADRDLLSDEISLSNVTMKDGLLVRSGSAGDTIAIDQALARCNAALLALRPRLTTIEAIDLWLRDIGDPDTFDEDELFGWVWYGLVHKSAVAPVPGNGVQLSFSSGVLRSTVSCSGGLRDWWGKIAERAAPIIREREIRFFPLHSEDIRAALALIDSGELTCQVLGPQSQRSHSSIIKIPYGSAQYDLRPRVVSAFDEYMHQVNGALIETTDELRADLMTALEQFNYEEPIETA